MNQHNVILSASVLTRAELLDHARQPRNRGELPDADIVQREDNPLCGDVVTVYAVLRRPERPARTRHNFIDVGGSAAGGSEGPRSPIGRDPSVAPLPQDDIIIDRVSFTGSGCIISQAAASLLTEYAVGKSVADLVAMKREDMEALIGGAVSPSRVKCAMLALIALKRGLSARQQATRLRQGFAGPAGSRQ